MNFTDKDKVKNPVIEEGDWERYIGTKQIEAMPCTAAGAAEILNRDICTDNANENAGENGDGYLVRYKDGYVSWSPSKAFEEAYCKIGREDRMLKWFSFEHLPPKLKKISKTFYNQAIFIASNIDSGPERTAAMRKLLEAKDAAVRAVVHPGG